MELNRRDFLKLSEGVAGATVAPKIGHAAGNILTPHVGDANTTIPEYKTFLCDVRRA